MAHCGPRFTQARGPGRVEPRQRHQLYQLAFLPNVTSSNALRELTPKYKLIGIVEALRNTIDPAWNRSKDCGDSILANECPSVWRECRIARPSKDRPDIVDINRSASWSIQHPQVGESVFGAPDKRVISSWIGLNRPRPAHQTRCIHGIHAARS